MTPRSTVSRRRFLQAGAAGCAAPLFVPASVLGTLGRASANERMTMGLIGCGGMGRANLNAFLGQGDVQVVAVCDPDARHRTRAKEMITSRYAEQTAAGTFKGCEEYNDFRDLLARDDIDAVVMATPDHWHALVVVAAARAGKDIYGEKPLSLTVRQGRVMSDAVRRHARVFQTGSQQRSGGQFRRACELVRNGRIGRIHTVTCGLPTGSTTGHHPPIPVPEGFDYDLWLGPAPAAPYCENRTHFNFRWILDYSGGQLTDWGAHHIDIAHWGLGATEEGPLMVRGTGTFPTEGLWDAATHYRFDCAYANGVTMIVTNDFENGVKFEGDEGWVFVSRGRIDASPKGLLDSEIGPNEIHLPKSPGHHRNFLDCMKNRREPIAPIEQAHRTITVAHLGNIAIQTGRSIRWDHRTERILGDKSAARMLDRPMREPWIL